MRTKITLSILLILAMASCTKWNYGDGHDDNDQDDDIIYEDVEVDEGINSGKPKIFLSPNEIIVKYDPSVTPEERDIIRNDYPLIAPPKSCNCGDTNIELWTFDPDIDETEIEGVVNGLKRRSPRGKTRGERSFDIQLTDVGPYTTQGQGVDGEEEPLLDNPGAASLNIAVIDTGLDFYRYLFEDRPKFLFPSGTFSDCYPTDTGWNFENNSGEIVDGNGHGTYITKIITDVLDEKGLDYQILPLKVFNNEGRGSYWDVICALGYIKNINDKGGEINIVNASFGGSMPRSFFEEADSGDTAHIFTELMDDLKNQGTLVVTSAGNDMTDNDNGPEGDFITSFESANILAVGGYEDDGIRPVPLPVRVALHPESNFGVKSIDVALAYNDYMLTLDTSESSRKTRVRLHGTSYAAAAMSGLAGVISEEAGGLQAERLKGLILRLAVESSELNGKIKDGKVILRD
ncbi:MAG: hypothetical protein Mars2KO_45370 [Maribacter sp.]